jgi:hypothetical protein
LSPLAPCGGERVGRSARKTAHGPARVRFRPKRVTVRVAEGDDRVMQASVAPEITWYRIRLAEVIRLPDVPPVLEEVRRAAAIGAQIIELDATDLSRLTDGARCLLESAQQRWAEQGVDVRFVTTLAVAG